MRNSTFDIMKGIGILAMIIGHCPIPLQIRGFIFAWHMPLFFIISGYFYKYTDFKILFKKNVKGLIKPYTFTVICCILLICTINIFTPPHYDIHISLSSCIGGALLGTAVDSFRFFEGYSIGPLWFLLALFWCKISYSFIDHFNISLLHKMVICVLLSVFAVVISSMIYIPTDILQGLNALPYFFMGVFFRKSCYLEFHISPIKLFPILTLCVSVLFVSICLGSLEMSVNKYSCYPINVLGSISAFYIIYIFSSSIRNTKIADRVRLLGSISILILSIHAIDDILQFYKFYKILFMPFHQTNVVYILGIMTWRILFAIALSLFMLRLSYIRKVFNLKQ